MKFDILKVNSIEMYFKFYIQIDLNKIHLKWEIDS